MSTDSKKPSHARTATTTTTTVRQPAIPPTSTREHEGLTWQEEMVVRMTRGLSEAGEHELEYRGRLHREPRARLAQLEAELLASMHGAGPLAEVDEAPAVEIQEEARDRIMERLRGLRKTDET